jgi:hypothetical protein
MLAFLVGSESVQIVFVSPFIRPSECFRTSDTDMIIAGVSEIVHAICIYHRRIRSGFLDGILVGYDEACLKCPSN